MRNVSPDELRRRAAGVESFDKYWFADPKTSEIRRKVLNGWQKFLNFFWKKRHRVSDLYWWVSKNWATEQMRVCPIAIEHDNIPAKGFPRKHKMEGGWTIPKDDLKYLYEGPLFDQTGITTFVKQQSLLQKIVSVVKQLRPLSWILGFLFVCIRYWEEIQTIMDRINAL